MRFEMTRRMQCSSDMALYFTVPTQQHFDEFDEIVERCRKKANVSCDTIDRVKY